MPEPVFVDVEPERFPMTIEFFRLDTGEVVLTEHIATAGSLLDVPPLKMQLGVAIGVRITDATGFIEETAR